MISSNNRILKIFILGFVSIIILWLLFLYIDITDIYEVFSYFSIIVILAGFLVYLITNLLRSFRFYYLLNDNTSFFDMFKVTCIHNMLNNIIPAKIGEFSFPYLLKRYGIKVSKSFSSLLIARIFDLLVICAIFVFIALISYPTMSDLPKRILPYVIGLFIFGILLLIFIFFFSEPILKKIKFKSRYPKLIVEKLIETVQFSKSVKNCNRFISVFLITASIWIMQFFMIFLLFNKIFNLKFLYTILGAILPILSTALPIQGLAGFGTIEGAWAIGFYGLGISKETAIASGFVYHLLILMYFSILGIFGLITIKK